MRSHDIDGWLVYDYRGMNPILQDTVGPLTNVTRPCWVWVPADGEARILASFVDQGRFGHIGLPTTLFVSRQDMLAKLKSMTGGAGTVAMEYSPGGALPRVSRVDGGTLETVRDLGVDVVSSADLVQFATQRWSPEQLDSHRWAAGLLDRIVQDALAYAGERAGTGLTEYDLAEFIRSRYRDHGLEAADGPVVAVNRHSSDPHFDPTPETAAPIERGDWLLIDLWARAPDDDVCIRGYHLDRIHGRRAVVPPAAGVRSGHRRPRRRPRPVAGSVRDGREPPGVAGRQRPPVTTSHRPASAATLATGSATASAGKSMATR